MKNQRSEALATQFATLNDAVSEFVETCSAALWPQACVNDNRSVAMVAYHIAASHGSIAQIIQCVALGQPLPTITMEMLDHANAQQAEQFAGCTQTEVLEALRTNGATTATLVNELSDEQLDHSAYISLFAANMSVQQVIEHVLIGHANSHLANLRLTVGGKA